MLLMLMVMRRLMVLGRPLEWFGGTAAMKSYGSKLGGHIKCGSATR